MYFPDTCSCSNYTATCVIPAFRKAVKLRVKETRGVSDTGECKQSDFLGEEIYEII